MNFTGVCAQSLLCYVVVTQECATINMHFNCSWLLSLTITKYFKNFLSCYDKSCLLIYTFLLRHTATKSQQPFSTEGKESLVYSQSFLPISLEGLPPTVVCVYYLKVRRLLAWGAETEWGGVWAGECETVDLLRQARGCFISARHGIAD